MDYVGYVAGILTLFVFVPQAIKTIRTKKTEGLSVITFVLTLLGATLWIIYGVSLTKTQIWAPNVIVASLSLIILYYKLKYG